MDFLESLKTRKVTRAFADKRIPNDLLRDLLEVAVNAPSGGNIQPWEVYVTNGAKTNELRGLIEQAVKDGKRTFGASYSGRVPEKYTKRTNELFRQFGPYLTEMGENTDYIVKGSLRFFEAPAVVFVYIHERLAPARLPCTGAFMVYLMLASAAYGLGSCPIGYVRGVDDVTRKFLGVSEDLGFVIAVALGYPEEAKPINRFKSGRVPAHENCRIIS
jgi:nitroreductase